MYKDLRQFVISKYIDNLNIENINNILDEICQLDNKLDSNYYFVYYKKLFGNKIPEHILQKDNLNYWLVKQFLLDRKIIKDYDSSLSYFKKLYLQNTCLAYKIKKTQFNINKNVLPKLIKAKQERNFIKFDKAQRLLKIRNLVLEDLIEEAKEEQRQLLTTWNTVPNSMQHYRNLCKFSIDENNIEKIKGFELLLQLGWYNKENPNGVVKDHRYSIYEGFINKISPSIVGHIANCEFIKFKDNAVKSKNSSITLNELIIEIRAFTL